MRKILVLAVTLSLFIFTGCFNKGGDVSMVPTATDLSGQTYEFVAFNDVKNLNQGMILQFIDESRLHAKICNNINAKYALTNNTLNLNEGISTKMACAEEVVSKMENAFLSGKGMRIDVKNNGDLHLTSSTDKFVLKKVKLVK